MVLFLLACADWPRFDHLAVDDTGGKPPVGADVGADPVSVWTDLSPREDSADDSPTSPPAELLGVGQGSHLAGRLIGSGWDESAAAVRPDCEGVPSAFPTEAAGDYQGDVDWRLVEFSSTGVWCSQFSPTDPQVRVDVIPFTLDACGNPAEPYVAERGRIVGFAPAAADNVWGVNVDSPGRYAVAAAAWSPDQPGKMVVYSWNLAFLELGSGRDTCAEIERP